MTAFAKFDRTTLKTLRSEMEAVLSKYGVDANLNIELGTMRFSDAEVEVKIKASIKGAVTRTDLNLQRMIAAYNLVAEKNGARLVRYDTKKPKYPFIYEKNGKMFKTTAEHAKLLFAA